MTFRILSIIILVVSITGCNKTTKVIIHKEVVIQKEKSEPGQDHVKITSPAIIVKEGINVLFTGDVMLDWGIQDILLKEGITYPLLELKGFLRVFDYRFCNLECPISDTGVVHKYKKYVFLGKPEFIDLLKFAEINGVSLANNHASDYGKIALLNTINNLNKNGIDTAGAGEDVDSARLPLTIKKKGIQLAVLAYTAIAYDDSFATEDTPGVAKAEIDLIKEDVIQFREFYDFIVISIHWGSEYSDFPSEKQARLARSIIDCGADVIIGHHSHIFQGIEIYKNRPIFYSLGNFIFGSINEDIRDNIIVGIKFLKNRIKSFQVFPINGNGNTNEPFKYKLLKGDHAKSSLNQLLRISEPLNSELKARAKIKGSTLLYEFGP